MLHFFPGGRCQISRCSQGLSHGQSPVRVLPSQWIHGLRILGPKDTWCFADQWSNVLWFKATYYVKYYVFTRLHCITTVFYATGIGQLDKNIFYLYTPFCHLTRTKKHTLKLGGEKERIKSKYKVKLQPQSAIARRDTRCCKEIACAYFLVYIWVSLIV